MAWLTNCSMVTPVGVFPDLAAILCSCCVAEWESWETPAAEDGWPGPLLAGIAMNGCFLITKQNLAC